MVTETEGPPGPRREDPGLLRGETPYTDDVHPEDVVHAAFLRSPHGHARLEYVDVGPAAAIDGVVAAFGAAELAAAGGPSGLTSSNHFPGPETVERPLLVGDRVRFCGDPVAAVFAEDRYVAADAANRIEVEYERLPAVTDPREAPLEGDQSISAVGPDTVEWSTGDADAADRACEAADTVVSLDLELPRLAAAPIEPRAVLAEYGREPPTLEASRAPADPESPGGGTEGGAERLTLTSSTQTPHRDRDRIAETLGLPSDAVRVLAPAVGGGFGPKGARPYPEEPLVAWAAMHLGRPVKWVATRSESQRSDQQGRDVYVSADLALDRDGTARGLRIRGHVGVGGYPFRGPQYCVRPNLLTGAYDVPAVHCHLVGALTNAPCLGPYRGAGRPEPIYVIERLMDRAAAAIDVDPAELRRRNYIASAAFPHETALGYTYDSGDYERALDLALEDLDYDAVREQRTRARAEGRHLGVGLASFVENTGSSREECGRVELHPGGAVVAYCGTADQGQGHATTFARLLADAFGIDPDAVDVREGDTDDLPTGTGTYASRSVSVGGSVLLECVRAVIEEARSIVADHFELAPADVDFEDGAFSVSGVPARRLSLAEVARLARSYGEAGAALSAERTGGPDAQTYAFGTHAAVVEVDSATGAVEVLRYVAVDDCGTRIEPALLDGQVHGGVVQGLGQALWEAVAFDDTGSMRTGSFLDYALPRAHRTPDVETDATVTPSPLTAHGGKGAGEAGTIAAPPAVANAVVDALAPLGVEHVDVPMTPETVWRAIRDAA